MDCVDIVHPDRHPNALVARFVAFRAEGHLDIASATTALTAFAQKDLTVAGADTTKRGGTAPIPGFLPSKLFEPSEALLYVGDVQYGCHPFRVHLFIPPSRQKHFRLAACGTVLEFTEHGASTTRQSFIPA